MRAEAKKDITPLSPSSMITLLPPSKRPKPIVVRRAHLGTAQENDKITTLPALCLRKVT